MRDDSWCQLMDFGSLLSVRWDAPFRFIASVLGIATVAAPLSGQLPLGYWASVTADLSWSWIAEPFSYADDWVRRYLDEPAALFLLLTAAVAWFAYTPSGVVAKTRASATVWVIAAIAAYSSPVWLIIATVVIAAFIRATASHYKGRDPFTMVLGMSGVHIFGGLIWAPLILVAWPLDTPPTRQEELRDALAFLRSGNRG